MTIKTETDQRWKCTRLNKPKNIWTRKTSFNLVLLFSEYMYSFSVEPFVLRLDIRHLIVQPLLLVNIIRVYTIIHVRSLSNSSYTCNIDTLPSIKHTISLGPNFIYFLTLIELPLCCLIYKIIGYLCLTGIHPFFRYPAHSLYKVNFSRDCRLMQIFWLFISLYIIIWLV